MTVLLPDDLALLRRFEPIACFNKGEQFYPMHADSYIKASRLCVKRPNATARTLVPAGKLNPSLLAQMWRDIPGAVYYLQFVDPLSPSQLLTFYRTSTLRHFHAGQGRLTRVGLVARAADLLFSLTLLMRGKVPGGMAAAAAQRYQAMQDEQETYYYYGRVVREHGYIVLQYWFFYAFNDWRSSFYGVNDHEGDWEMITVYAVDDVSGDVQPCWVAYSSHEFEGDDLRRRWDDPELERLGDHPIVYIAAGSHANYYQAGEYLPAVEVPFTGRMLRIWRRIQHFWRVTLRQGGVDIDTEQTPGIFRIPFVDFARGDGLHIGPGQEKPWQVALLQATPTEPTPAWLDSYRGLWGLYTGDWIEGEDAPAGPRYTRAGTVRKSWYNPLGWSGLDKVPPPHEESIFLELQQQRLRDEQDELQRQIAKYTNELMALEMEAEAIYGLPHLEDRTIELHHKLRGASAELDSLKQRRAENAVVLEACAAYVNQMATGYYRGPRDHLRVPQEPASSADLRLSRLAEIWGALSIGLLLLSFAAIVTQVSSAWEVGVLALLGVYSFIEALFRRQIQMLVRYIVVALALITALVLIYEFFWELVVTLVVLAGILIIVENLRELRMRV